MLENLAEEFERELRRCGWKMTDELVFSAVSVYLNARVRKLEALKAETENERRKRLDKKREQGKRYRYSAKLRDIGDEVFGGHGGASSVVEDPALPQFGSTVARTPWSDLEARRERIEETAERRRRRKEYS